MKKSEQTEAIIQTFYDAFCAKDWDRMLSCVDEHIVHDRPGSQREKGKAAFRAYLANRAECYDEQVSELNIEISPSGDEAEVEYDITGTYNKTDAALPPATGQSYELSAGAFILIKGGKITRLSIFYSLDEWLRQVKK